MDNLEGSAADLKFEVKNIYVLCNYLRLTMTLTWRSLSKMTVPCPSTQGKDEYT